MPEYITEDVVKATLRLAEAVQRSVSTWDGPDDFKDMPIAEQEDYVNLPNTLNYVTNAIESHLLPELMDTVIPTPGIPLLCWLDDGRIVEGVFCTDVDGEDKCQFKLESCWLPGRYGNDPEFEKRRGVEKFTVVKWCYKPTPQVFNGKKVWRCLNGKSTSSK